MARIHRRTTQKDLHDSDNHDGVITHLEPDILECELKWALENITTNKASGDDGIPVELFQILKDDELSIAAFNMPANLENSAVATGLERSVFIPIPKKGNAKECSNYRTIALISHTSKVMLKILQATIQAVFRKGRGTRDQTAKIHWIIKKSKTVPEKKSTFVLLTMPKHLTL